jgi:hypothetical protein
VTPTRGASGVPVETPAGATTLQPGKAITIPTCRPHELAIRAASG